ncbi:MAG: hypothetical protein K8S14_01575 [Actinomycetia bacterium]|nr:hypothetical protein [Actinomycetes bacterium]
MGILENDIPINNIKQAGEQVVLEIGSDVYCSVEYNRVFLIIKTLEG